MKRPFPKYEIFWITVSHNLWRSPIHGGTRKSSMLFKESPIINKLFWGSPIYENPYIYVYIYDMILYRHVKSWTCVSFPGPFWGLSVAVLEGRYCVQTYRQTLRKMMMIGEWCMLLDNTCYVCCLIFIVPETSFW